MTSFMIEQGTRMPGFSRAFGSVQRPHVCPTRAIQIIELTSKDAQLQTVYFEGLSDTSKYFRFMAPLSGLSRSLAGVLCNVHRDNHVVLMAAVREQGCVNMIGEARFVRKTAQSTQAEFAISIADDWQGTGLASKLMTALETRASQGGVTSLHGSVLRSNEAMKCFAERNGYKFHQDANEARVVKAVKTLVPTSPLH
ncbi:MAG: GNAT family N-acetyltransferase [Rhizobiaceae bacterium]